MSGEVGRVASRPGSREPSPDGLGPSGFDPSRGDPAFDLPLPEMWALDEAARLSGFNDWFSVPAAFQTPQNRAIIVSARIIAKTGRLPARDSDGSPKGGDGEAGSVARDDSAGRRHRP